MLYKWRELAAPDKDISPDVYVPKIPVIGYPAS
jgi:hypothetical protein